MNIYGYCNAHRYGYDSINNKCYDLGITDVMPKIDYTEFVFDFVPNGYTLMIKLVYCGKIYPMYSINGYK